MSMSTFVVGLALMVSCLNGVMSQYSVTWTTPTVEPGKTGGNRLTYQGAMPLGNGGVTALVWPNVTQGGVFMYLGHQNAQSSYTELFKIARLEVTLSPNPFDQGSFFNQTLDLKGASVSVYAGGTSVQHYGALIKIWIDASVDQVFLDVSAGTASNVSYQFAASLHSVRPNTVWNYPVPFHCTNGTAHPDVFVDPIPKPFDLHMATRTVRPQSPAESVRHASGWRRPLRQLRGKLPSAIPRIASFQKASVIIYHRNMAADGLSVPMVLQQQGLAELIPTTPDHWQDNQFGCVMDGADGPKLMRTSPTTLKSIESGSAFRLRLTILAVQTDTVDDWLQDLAALVATSEPTDTLLAAHQAWWDDFWSRSYIHVNASQTDGAAARLSQMYAVTRFVQAIQSRADKTIWPIKFNGMAFVAAMDMGAGEADYRDWGPSNWWQNTRLPYGAMLSAGDFEQFAVILEYYANMEKLLSPRTLLYWNHTGMWTTETQHLSGAYDMSDYGCEGTRKGLPMYLEQSGFLHVDQGGDSGTGEYALMVLDYLLWTGDEERAKPFLKIPFAAADFFMYHFPNRNADGRVIVWPAQVLETWWCDYNTTVQNFTNCCEDDSPTISGMYTLFEKLLSLPEALAPPTKRQEWQDFKDKLMPLLPVNATSSVILPARVTQNGPHNNEGPELYAIHPHRIFTKGRQVAEKRDISVGEITFNQSTFAQENSGWNYGINAAALIGATEVAAAQVLERAATGPATGYRFEGFAPHFQDFEPSADHFANMNRALQDMLLQSGDNGFQDTSIVLFPAWPCNWDVQAKLWGPLNTTIIVEYAKQRLVSLEVLPDERKASVIFANCVSS